MEELETVDAADLETVTGGFAFLIPLIGAALGAVQGGMKSKTETGKIDWGQVASGALGGLGLGGLGGSSSGGQQQQAAPSGDVGGSASAAQAAPAQ